MQNMKKSKLLSYEINDIELYGFHGVLEKEIKDGQNFYIDITYNINDFKYKDDISEVLDYTNIVKIVSDVFNLKRRNLLEILVKNIYNSIINTCDVIDLKVSIRKKNPVSFENIKFIKVSYPNE
jgi:dihydroneopterin aldolase